MIYLNLEIRVLTSPEFLGSEPTERATWLCLQSFCAQQENGGTIKNCGSWADRKWQQLVGITKDEAMSESELWTLNDNNISVWEYPVKTEAKVRSNRVHGKLGGKPKPSPNPPKPPRKPSELSSIDPHLKEPTAKEVKEEANKEGKIMTEEQAQDFIDHYKAQGWRKPSGAKIFDWRSLVKKWDTSGSDKEETDDVKIDVLTEKDVKEQEAIHA